jgi:hypothetical protein
VESDLDDQCEKALHLLTYVAACVSNLVTLRPVLDCCLLHNYWLDRSSMAVGAGENADETKFMHFKVIQENLELVSLRSCCCRAPTRLLELLASR